jgi:hypothetical protein
LANEIVLAMGTEMVCPVAVMLALDSEMDVVVKYVITK